MEHALFETTLRKIYRCSHICMFPLWPACLICCSWLLDWREILQLFVLFTLH